MNIYTERSRLIIESGKYSDSEIHDINEALCTIRDSDNAGNTEVSKKWERLLNLFILKKKLGDPVSFKKLIEMSDLDNSNESSIIQ